MNVTVNHPAGCTSLCPRRTLSRVWLFLRIHTGKALMKQNPFKMLFIARSPGSRSPASADFRPLSRKAEARMGHDSSPGWAVFSRFKLLGSCQALFWELNSTRLRPRPRQERSASCSTPDQTSARMSAGTVKAPRNLPPPLGLGLSGCQ